VGLCLLEVGRRNLVAIFDTVETDKSGDNAVILKRILGAAVLVSGVCGGALADERDTIMQSCQIQATIPSSACPCITDKVLAEFNEKEMAFFLAVITQDKSGQAAAQGNMTINELQHVAMRMTALPAECSS
jgi:hypothetical protein